MDWNEVNGTSTNDICSMLFFWQFFLSASSPSFFFCIGPVVCFFPLTFSSMPFLHTANIFFFFWFCSYMNVNNIFGIFTVFGAWDYGHQHIVLSIEYGYFNNIQPMIQYQIYETQQILRHFIFHFNMNVSGVRLILMGILNIN